MRFFLISACSHRLSMDPNGNVTSLAWPANAPHMASYAGAVQHQRSGQTASEAIFRPSELAAGSARTHRSRSPESHRRTLGSLSVH